MDIYQSVGTWLRHRSTPLTFSLLALAIVVTCSLKTNQSLYWSLGLWAALILCLCYWIIRPSALDLLAFSLPILAVANSGFRSIHLLLLPAVWLIGLFILWFNQRCNQGFTTSSVKLYFAIPILLYMLIVMNSQLFSPYGPFSISCYLNILIFIITYWLMDQILEDQNLYRIITTVALGALVGGMIYLYALGVSNPFNLLPLILSGIVRPDVLGVNPNNWAFYAHIGWPIALAFLFYGRNNALLRCFWILCAFFFLVVALITMSRTAFFAIFATSLFILLTHTKGRRILLVAGILGLVVFIFYSPMLLSEFKTLLRFKAGLSGREQLWTVAWQIILQYPFSGIGPRHLYHWAFFNAPFIENGLSTLITRPTAHSLFFHSGLEFGIFAPLLILTIFVMFAHRCVLLWRYVKPTTDFIVLVVISAEVMASFVRTIFETVNLVPILFIQHNLTMILMFALQDQLCHRYLPKK